MLCRLQILHKRLTSSSQRHQLFQDTIRREPFSFPQDILHPHVAICWVLPSDGILYQPHNYISAHSCLRNNPCVCHFTGAQHNPHSVRNFPPHPWQLHAFHGLSLQLLKNVFQRQREKRDIASRSNTESLVLRFFQDHIAITCLQ